MNGPELAQLCAEAVADLTAGGCPGGVTAAEVALWITDGGGTATADEVTAALERLALRGLLCAARGRRSGVRLWRPAPDAAGTLAGYKGSHAARVARFAALRRAGTEVEEAARQVGVTNRTGWRYETALARDGAAAWRAA